MEKAIEVQTKPSEIVFLRQFYNRVQNAVSEDEMKLLKEGLNVPTKYDNPIVMQKVDGNWEVINGG